MGLARPGFSREEQTCASAGRRATAGRLEQRQLPLATDEHHPPIILLSAPASRQASSLTRGPHPAGQLHDGADQTLAGSLEASRLTPDEFVTAMAPPMFSPSAVAELAHLAGQRDEHFNDEDERRWDEIAHDLKTTGSPPPLA